MPLPVPDDEPELFDEPDPPDDPPLFPPVDPPPALAAGGEYSLPAGLSVVTFTGLSEDCAKAGALRPRTKAAAAPSVMPRRMARDLSNTAAQSQNTMQRG